MATVPGTWFSTWPEIHAFELGLLLGILIVLLRHQYRPLSHGLAAVALIVWIVPPTEILAMTIAAKPWYYLLALIGTEVTAWCFELYLSSVSQHPPKSILKTLISTRQSV